jgi:hypothetical protein
MAGAIASFGVGFVCLACVLPGIGAVVGLSVLVTAVGGIADDCVLTLAGVGLLATSLALGAYVLLARRRSQQACATAEPKAVSDSSG